MEASIDAILQNGRCTSGTAAKIRGKAGWAATAVHGKCGRIGQWSLVQRQYFDIVDFITPDLERSLQYIKLLHVFVGPRAVPIWYQR